jgi:hypothetical protein
MGSDTNRLGDVGRINAGNGIYRVNWAVTMKQPTQK